MAQTYRIRIVKLNKPSKYKYQVVKVSVDKKYKYFVITTKIYKHEIVETIRYDDCDYIEIYDEKCSYGMFTFTNDKPIKVVNQE